MIDPTPEQIEREFANWRNSEIDQTGTLPTGYEMFRAAYNLAASAVSGRHDHIEDGSSYLDCIACGAAISMTNPSPEQIEAAAVALCNSRRAHLGLSPIDRLPWSKDAPKYRAEASAALVAAAGAAPRGDDLVERVADTLAYYQCRETNPKADDPRMGYHSFSEEQRAHLRERKAEAAAEIVRMFAAAGAAPQEPAAGDQGELIAEAGKHSKGEPQHCDCGRPGCDGQAYCTWCGNEWPCLSRRLADALAAPPQVDEAKLSEVIGWEAPGWDNRKELASLFQDHSAIPDEMTLESIYPALIAVAGYGYELAKEHVLAAAAEHSRGGGR